MALSQNERSAVELASDDERHSELGADIPELVSLARETIRQNLPRLLKEKDRGEWVAYSGTTFIGRGESKADLYAECARQGLHANEYLIINVELEQEAVEDALSA